MKDKEIIEAALFIAGEGLDQKQLANLIKKKNLNEIVGLLIDEYRNRETAIEIIESDGKYVMQVKSEYIAKVRRLAPKEISSPVLRTLSIIAYHQPITQSELSNMRGSIAYTHVKELEERGLISANPRGRTKQLQTTSRFAEYFGLEKDNPEEIKKRIVELAHEQKVGLDKWLRMEHIGVTRMYETLMPLCGIEEYTVVNPYSPTDEDKSKINDLDVLIVSLGYGERVEQYYKGKIIEAGAATFEDLIDTINLLSDYGDKRKAEESIEKIKTLRNEYRKKSLSIEAKVTPATDMAARIAGDLNLNISSNGVNIAPDYMKSSNGKDVGVGADILIPTHQNAEGDIITRVCKRYDAILSGLKRFNTR